MKSRTPEDISIIFDKDAQHNFKYTSIFNNTKFKIFTYRLLVYCALKFKQYRYITSMITRVDIQMQYL